MGQYYKPIVQAIKYDENHTQIRKTFSFIAHDFNEGIKLCEHSHKETPFVKFITNFIYHLNKQDWKTQLVWAGDYANEIFGGNDNLYETIKCNDVTLKVENGVIVSVEIDGFDDVIDMTQDHHYLVNHDRNEYINTLENNGAYSQLALLTADGNGKGGGDYFGENWRNVGLWRYHEISVMDKQELDEYLKEESKYEQYHPHCKWIKECYQFMERY